MFKIQDFFKNSGDRHIAVVGLGYVGLPLSIALNSKYNVIGFDINEKRISSLKSGYDVTNEISENVLKESTIKFTANSEELRNAEVLIVTVPTPINRENIPDLTPVLSATKLISENLSKGSVVVYESTFYPGLTEEKCVPVIEKGSGFKWKKDFFVGYSPERVNPGDKEHTIEKIVKIVSADTEKTANFLKQLYGEVITAGIHLAPTIKTAEAAKVIENTQRDINIALMNELSVIFHKMGIDTRDVIEAASTKWNFLKFEPGLVGGHCIGVDPYYLTFKAQSIGYHPETILAGRKINDYMGKYVAENCVKNIIKTGKPVKSSKVLILGLTFKENIKDIRNTKVIDIYNELTEYEMDVSLFDPYVDKDEVLREYKISVLDNIEDNAPYNAVILSVKHKFFLDNLNLGKIKSICTENPLLIDVKGVFTEKEAVEKGFSYWRL